MPYTEESLDDYTITYPLIQTLKETKVSRNIVVKINCVSLILLPVMCNIIFFLRKLLTFM